MPEPTAYPVRFSVEYPDRELDRVSTLLRPFLAIPILIVLASVFGPTVVGGDEASGPVWAAGGLLFAGPLLMILFRRKYPRWWYDWNLELLRFANRVVAYLALMDDRYPSTDERQSVALDIPYPDGERELNRWMPLVKWLLAIPHVLVLIVLSLGAVGAVILAWFAILFTGRYPEPLFRFVEGVLMWHVRVVSYAVILLTDRYPPFSFTQEVEGLSPGGP